MQTITSMSRIRFEELRSGIFDGTLAQRWDALADKEGNQLTRKQRVELRQIAAISNIAESDPELLRWLVKTDWREFRLVHKGDLVQVVVKHGKQSVVPPLMYGGVWKAEG